MSVLSSTSVDVDQPMFKSLADTSDSAYERRHRKFEMFERRQRLREKEKLQHDHYKLKERIEQLRAMDGVAFMTLSESNFSPPPIKQAANDESDEMFAILNGGTYHPEGERRKKEMLDVALDIERRYSHLLPSERSRKGQESTTSSVARTMDVGEEHDLEGAFTAGPSKKDSIPKLRAPILKTSVSNTSTPSPIGKSVLKKGRPMNSNTRISSTRSRRKSSPPPPPEPSPSLEQVSVSSPVIDVEEETPEPEPEPGPEPLSRTLPAIVIRPSKNANANVSTASSPQGSYSLDIPAPALSESEDETALSTKGTRIIRMPSADGTPLPFPPPLLETTADKDIVMHSSDRDRETETFPDTPDSQIQLPQEAPDPELTTGEQEPSKRSGAFFMSQGDKRSKLNDEEKLQAQEQAPTEEHLPVVSPGVSKSNESSSLPFNPAELASPATMNVPPLTVLEYIPQVGLIPNESTSTRPTKRRKKEQGAHRFSPANSISAQSSSGRKGETPSLLVVAARRDQGKTRKVAGGRYAFGTHAPDFHKWQEQDFDLPISFRYSRSPTISEDEDDEAGGQQYLPGDVDPVATARQSGAEDDSGGIDQRAVHSPIVPSADLPMSERLMVAEALQDLQNGSNVASTQTVEHINEKTPLPAWTTIQDEKQS